jgi:hypothetical protein
VTCQVEELRIVDDDTWKQVQARKQRYANTHPSHQRRPKHLLAGYSFAAAAVAP